MDPPDVRPRNMAMPPLNASPHRWIPSRISSKPMKEGFHPGFRLTVVRQRAGAATVTARAPSRYCAGRPGEFPLIVIATGSAQRINGDLAHTLRVFLVPLLLCPFGHRGVGGFSSRQMISDQPCEGRLDRLSSGCRACPSGRPPGTRWWRLRPRRVAPRSEGWASAAARYGHAGVHGGHSSLVAVRPV